MQPPHVSLSLSSGKEALLEIGLKLKADISQRMENPQKSLQPTAWRESQIVPPIPGHAPSANDGAPGRRDACGVHDGDHEIVWGQT